MLTRIVAKYFVSKQFKGGSVTGPLGQQNHKVLAN
jgi:hypothetical protein